MESKCGIIEDMSYTDVIPYMYDMVRNSGNCIHLIFSGIKEMGTVRDLIKEYCSDVILTSSRRMIRLKDGRSICLDVVSGDIGLYGGDLIMFGCGSYPDELRKSLMRSIRPVYLSTSSKVCICISGME